MLEDQVEENDKKIEKPQCIKMFGGFYKIGLKSNATAEVYVISVVKLNQVFKDYQLLHAAQSLQ